ncbi:septal ring lytic transglycosylase RlpA family protein [Altererythrobacter indicus]|uniref:Endolytic peptidoglycan transglycosylase RlpA n=1 Tax=Altericroceibacterium indicum TaxID=374177 RepID=A0A845A8C7_9SPHN|nr:septal ring lytic transglycosylase RlpA family protein [Altericroceibacterium indicum]MXP25503.1 septal ring lytic transglycosylase RlpA family protein [Altericroceibacterium indicum]
MNVFGISKRYTVLGSAGLMGLALAFAPGHAEESANPEIVPISGTLTGLETNLPRFEPSATDDGTDANPAIDLDDDDAAISASSAIDDDAQAIGAGEASWYGPKFRGRRTANGETFDPSQLTAAHRSLPFGSKVKVTYARTGKSVIVRINDRGPYAHNRVIDLSEAAAREIGIRGAGSGHVTLALLQS